MQLFLFYKNKYRLYSTDICDNLDEIWTTKRLISGSLFVSDAKYSLRNSFGYEYKAGHYRRKIDKFRREAKYITGKFMRLNANLLIKLI